MNVPPGAVILDGEHELPLINATDIPTSTVQDALAQDRALVATLEKWATATQPALTAQEAVGSYLAPGERRQGGIFLRDRYLTPTRPFDQMRIAYEAVATDDIVAGVADATESLAFTNMDIFALDEEEQDVYNQIAAQIDLDGRMREIWRDLFTVSQAYVAVWWKRQTFKVRGRTDAGNERRKEYTVVAPAELSLLDPLRVVPVGSTLFGQERLAFIATPDESAQFEAILAGGKKAMDDEIVKRLVRGRYTPDQAEARELQALGVPNVKDLWLLDPDNVWRHTLTRPAYQRLATVRLKSVFELLDMKAQLRQMERAYLIGNALRVDQRVATPDGWKPIGAVEVGDEVFSVDGNTTTVTGVFPQGERPMYKVTFTDGAFTYCDPGHLWTVRNPWGRQRTLRLDEIMAEGLTQKHGSQTALQRHRIPIAAPLELPEISLPLDPYLIGYMIGDGSFTQSMPKITCGEPEDDQPWRAALPPGMSVSQYETREGFCNQYGLRGVAWHCNPVMDGLRSLGLWGAVDADKFIPEKLLWASAEQRWALLQGLCDSDGHSSIAGGVEYSTISLKLAEGVVHLAQSLGAVARIYVKEPRRPTHRLAYRVWISIAGPEAPFRLKRKQQTWRPRKCQYVRAIRSIEPADAAEAVCIKVDRPDGLFLTEGMLVTHNTNFILVVTKGTDQHPALQSEVTNLQAMVRSLARVPVLVGDHRLSVEIVTPKLDNTLRAERWNTIDARISGRLYQLLVLGNYSAGASGDDSIKLVKVIARGMESRRHMMRRSIEKHVLGPLFDKNSELKTKPKLRFHPRSIALDFDAAYASFLFDLRQANELSRETILNQFDLDEALEAELRKREKVKYDPIFKTQVPFSTPNPANPANPPQPPDDQNGAPPPPAPRDNGGGRRNGGGAAPGTGQGQPPRRRPARPAAASETRHPEQPIPGTDNQGDDDADADVPT